MVYRVILTCVLLISISACAAGPQRPVLTPRLTMMDIYANSVGDSQEDTARAVQENLKEQKTFGYVKPYIPVMTSPVVRKVWIPDHRSDEDGAVLVAGHWVYVMVQPPRWFIQEETKNVDVPVIIPSGPVQKQERP